MVRPRLSLCLCLVLVAGCQSQLKFRTKFNSAPTKDLKRVTSPSFEDQASQFRRVFFNRRRPKEAVLRSTTSSTTRDRDDFDFQGTLEKEVSNPGVNNESKRVEVKETLVDATTEATTASVDEEITSNVSSILEKMKLSEIKVSAIEKNPRQPAASARNVSEVKEDVKAIRNNNFQRPQFSPLSSISRKAAPATTSTVTSSIPSSTWGTTETSTISTSISTDPSLRTTSLEKYEEIVTNAVEMMEDVFLETLDNDHAKESRPVLRYQTTDQQ